MKTKEHTLKNRAIMYRNQQDKLLYDVAVINHAEETAEITLQQVHFDVASWYVEDYNSAVVTN